MLTINLNGKHDLKLLKKAFVHKKDTQYQFITKFLKHNKTKISFVNLFSDNETPDLDS